MSGALQSSRHETEPFLVSIDDLVRVAHLYALAAIGYCGAGQNERGS